MNKTTTTLLIIGMALLATGQPHSSAEAARTPLQSLQALKEANQKLIDQQTATLQKIEEMAKAAQQMRAFGKRG